MKLSRYIGPNMSRATQQGSLIDINAAASEEHAKACLKYMELLYTDREFRDLLAYGIEGEHFRYYEGTVIRIPKDADDYLMDTYVTGPGEKQDEDIRCSIVRICKAGHGTDCQDNSQKNK